MLKGAKRPNLSSPVRGVMIVRAVAAAGAVRVAGSRIVMTGPILAPTLRPTARDTRRSVQRMQSVQFSEVCDKKEVRGTTGGAAPNS
jgi:hypothetical protein